MDYTIKQLKKQLLFFALISTTLFVNAQVVKSAADLVNQIRDASAAIELTFDPDLAGTTLTITQTIEFNTNVTIDGEELDITITYKPETLIIPGKPNTDEAMFFEGISGGILLFKNLHFENEESI